MEKKGKINITAIPTQLSQVAQWLIRGVLQIPQVAQYLT